MTSLLLRLRWSLNVLRRSVKKPSGKEQDEKQHGYDLQSSKNETGNLAIQSYNNKTRETSMKYISRHKRDVQPNICSFAFALHYENIQAQRPVVE